MKISRTLLLLALTLLPFAAHAQDAAPAASAPAVDRHNIPNLISVGMGAFDVMPNDPRLQAVDFRLEHRWGLSLLSPNATTTSWFQIHPFAGVETSSRAQFYGFGGFVFDMLMGEHAFLSPNLAAGYYNKGNGKYMGCALEFRSTFEAGWRFDNQTRLTGYFGHMSNANLTHVNSGAEIAGLYFEFPLSTILGQ